MRKRNKQVAGLLFAAFVLLWLKSEELMASMGDLLASFAGVLAVIPASFWIVIGLAVLLGTLIVSGAFLIRMVRRDPPPSG